MARTCALAGVLCTCILPAAACQPSIANGLWGPAELRSDTPVGVVAMPSNDYIAETGGLSTWNGEEVAALTLTADDGSADMHLLLHGGRTSPVPDAGGGSRVILPFVSPAGRPSLAWAGPRREAIHRPPDVRLQRFWVSELAEDGTRSAPMHMVDAGLYMSVEPGGSFSWISGFGWYAAIVTIEGPNEQRLYVGRLGEELREVDFADDEMPLAASVQRGTDGDLWLAVQLSSLIGRPPEIRLYTSKDVGATWTFRERIARTLTGANSLRLIVDAAGIAHVTSQHVERVRHWWRAGEDWTPSSPAEGFPGGILLGALGGADRCGRLTLVRFGIRVTGEAVIHVERWVDGGWAAEGLLPGMFGAELVEGWSEDGSWIVGWTGVSGSPEQETLSPLSFWSWRP